MESDMNYPIILPKNSKFTKLLLKHYRKSVFHNGVHKTLNQIRT